MNVELIEANIGDAKNRKSRNMLLNRRIMAIIFETEFDIGRRFRSPILDIHVIRGLCNNKKTSRRVEMSKKKC